VIQRIEEGVPAAVWFALATVLALALASGIAAVVQRRRARRQASRLAALRAQALTDLLTGVLNRRGFLAIAERELARARRHQRPLALAFVDVRGLKAINDSQGHQAGDELLRQTARILRQSCRGSDVIGRIGGDELAVLLPGHTSAEAAAGRIVTRVAQCRNELQLRGPWDLTVGTAVYPADGKTIKELLATADRRLYERRGIQLRSNGHAPSNGRGGSVSRAPGERRVQRNGRSVEPRAQRNGRSIEPRAQRNGRSVEPRPEHTEELAEVTPQ
jgi:diguanylate cyclase (GGDEF)-like protein